MNFKRMIPMMMIASAPLAGMAQGKAGIIESNLDRSANPAEDFYQFATGGWQKANPLPAAYSRFGSFDQLQENNNKRINGILSELLKKNYSKGTVEQKLSDFYKLAMDSVRRNREGVAPVKPILDQMEAARTVADLQKVQGKYGVFGYGVPMGMGFGADEKNAKMNIFNIYQGGLTLGQREYYLDNDQTTADIRNAYKQFIVDMFKLFGFTEQQAQQKRDLIMRFETALALISKSQTELRDVEANYNKFTLKQFETDYPNIHLQQLCAAQGIQPQYIQEMIVGQPAFLAGLDKLLATQTADELRAYMEWDVINQAANYLSDDARRQGGSAPLEACHLPGGRHDGRGPWPHLLREVFPRVEQEAHGGADWQSPGGPHRAYQGPDLDERADEEERPRQARRLLCQGGLPQHVEGPERALYRSAEVIL